MTTPIEGRNADDFLATTQTDASGNITTEYVKLQDVSNELLMHYATLGDDRAIAELAARLDVGTDTEPAPEEETP